jgi:hypothetical protein
MNNSTLRLKVMQRLNKLASNDYDNIECWQIVEAFNKAQVQWVRRQLVGINILKQGDEQSKRKIDDLQPLLSVADMAYSDMPGYVISETLPDDYMEFKRVDAYGKNDCCPDPRRFVVYLAEEANAAILLRDDNKKPSFDWAETFCTLAGNKIKIYTNDDFIVTDAKLMYYREPVKIQIQGCVNPYTGFVSAADVECEFKEDVTETLIDEAVQVLAGDIESITQYQIAGTSGEENS